MKPVPSPHPFTATTGRAAWRGLLGLAAIWLAAGCTRLAPPRYNLSSSDPPRLLLQTGARAWIGVRHADRRGVFAMSPAFAALDSFMCVYNHKKSYAYVAATHEEFNGTYIRVCAGYRKEEKQLPGRLLAVIAAPGDSSLTAAAPAKLGTGEPGDGIMCTRRCNRTHRPGQYLKVEIVAPAPAPALPLPARTGAGAGAEAGAGASVAEETP